jgi:hypothetical protein
VRGRRIAVLGRGPWAAGPHTIAWNGRDDGDRPVPPGVYFATLEAAGRRTTARFAITR